MYQQYYNQRKKTRNEKQADVVTSEISGPSRYTPVSLPLISVVLIPTYNHISDLSDFNSLGVLLCSVIKFDHDEISGEKHYF